MQPMLAAAAALTALSIAFSPGDGGAAKHWTLRCGPASGTLPQPARACRRLAALTNPFAPVPDDAVCTQVYGGPQTARVTGSFRGRPVRARFARGNGCEIARWRRVGFLFPFPS
jgi:hypothetical protein